MAMAVNMALMALNKVSIINVFIVIVICSIIEATCRPHTPV